MTSRKTLDIDFITLRKIRAVNPETNALITPNFILAMDNQGQAQWVNTLSNINTYGGVTGFTGPTGPINQSAMVTLVANSNQTVVSGTPSVVEFPSIDLNNSTATNFGITWDSSGSVFTNTTDLPLQVLLTWQVGWNQLPGTKAEYKSLTTYAQVNGSNSYGYQTNDYGLGNIQGNANPSQTSSCVVLLDPSSSFSIYVNQVNTAGCPATTSSASKLIMTLIQTGPQGSTGEMGYTGMTGPTGIQGLTGYTGMTGPAGIINITTVQGITGNILYTSNIPDPSDIFYSTFATIIDNNGTGILGINGSVQIGPTGTISSDVSGNLILNTSLLPATGYAYDLGSTGMPWNELYVGTGSVHIGPTGTISADVSGNLILNTNLLPATGYAYDLGSTGQPWNELYVGTGSVHIGPTGTISADVSGNLILNTNLLPATGYAYDLGSTGMPWNELYVGTGSVHIGPTGTISADQTGNMLLKVNTYLGLTGPQGFSRVYDEVYNPLPSSTVLTTGASYTLPSETGQYLVEFTLYGGGGGGGGSPNNECGGGGGGGSGSVTNGQVLLLPNAVITYSIGGGGSSDTNGTSTTLTINSSRSPPLTFTAAGGSAGGPGGSGDNGGNGGAGGEYGGGGGAGIANGSNPGPGTGGVGTIQSGSIGGTNNGGNGGGAVNGGISVGGRAGGGGGGIGGGGGSTGNGMVATLFGCGGGGGGTPASSFTLGGNGEQGYIVLRITQLISDS